MTEEKSFAISVRVKHLSKSKYAGQRRHDLRIGKQPGYVDGDRAHLNRVLVELPMPAFMNARNEELRKKAEMKRASKSTSAIATSGIVTFGTEAQELFMELTEQQQDAAIREVVETIAADSGSVIRGLVVHLDETAPHAHFILDSRNEEGRPMSKIMKGSRIQDLAAEAIGRHAPGIVRGVRKSVRVERGDDMSKIVHRSVRQLHLDLPKELDAKREELDGLVGRVDEMRGRVEKLEAMAERSEKEEKRLATYRKRLEDRVREYNEAVERLREREEQARVEVRAIEQRARIVDRAEEELDQREAQLEAREVEIAKKEAMLDRLLDDVRGLVGEAAEALGVSRTLRAIRDRLTAWRRPDSDIDLDM